MPLGIEYVWQDRKRHFGLPLSFTRYRLSQDRLFIETGVIQFQEEEIMLYRVQDLHLTISLGQRFCGVGTVIVLSSDKSSPEARLENIRRPREVKEKLHRLVENAKRERRMSVIESMGGRFDMGGLDEMEDGFL